LGCSFVVAPWQRPRGSVWACWQLLEGSDLAFERRRTAVILHSQSQQPTAGNRPRRHDRESWLHAVAPARTKRFHDEGRANAHDQNERALDEKDDRNRMPARAVAARHPYRDAEDQQDEASNPLRWTKPRLRRSRKLTQRPAHHSDAKRLETEDASVLSALPRYTRGTIGRSTRRAIPGSTPHSTARTARRGPGGARSRDARTYGARSPSTVWCG
jgi:hypothetical protein